MKHRLCRSAVEGAGLRRTSGYVPPPVRFCSPPPPCAGEERRSLAATIGQGDIRVIVNALGTVTPIATVAVQTQLSGRLLEVGFTEGGQEAQPVTWYSDRNSKFSFATEEQLAGEGSQELIAHIRPGQQARYLN